MRAKRRYNTRAELDLLARMDAAFADQIATLTKHQLSAIRTWQRTDRAYAFVQQVARGEVAIDHLAATALEEVLTLQQALDDAIDSCRLPIDLNLYRGVRSLRHAFDTEDFEDLQGRVLRLDGYSATSMVRRIAVEEFTTPSGALMEMAVPAGTPALWVCGAGSDRLRYQAEVLLEDHLQICIVGHRSIGSLVVLSVEVTGQ